jgi:signal transduction histidine kinase/CheY-like chemotaxis protein
MAYDPKDPSGSRLGRDPILWLGGLVAVVLLAPFFIPGIARSTLANWTEGDGTLLALALVVVALELGFRKNLPSNVQIFRHTLAAAFGTLVTKHILYKILPEEAFWGSAYAEVMGYAFPVFFFLVFTAFATAPHRSRPSPERAWLRLIRPLGTILIAFSLYIYFIGMPVASEVKLVPGARFFNLTFYVLLDAALLILIWHQRRMTESGVWRSVYGWFALAFGLGLATDTLDLATRIGPLPWIDYGTPLDLLWFLWYGAIIVAARILAHSAFEPAPAAYEDAEAARSLLIAFGGSRWLIYALSLPILHFSLRLAGMLDPRLDSARDTLTLLFVVSMGFVALFRERLLSSENLRLDRARTAANEQLQLARRLEGIGRLAAGVAHEFNNKLTVILASSELLQAQLAPQDTRRKFTTQIMETANQAAKVVSQLLGFSRKQVSHPRVVNLNVQITEIAELLKPVLGEDVEIRLELERNLPLVEIDPDHVEQMLMNLAVNARQAMPRGGQLTFRTKSSPRRGASVADGTSLGEVVVSVTDSGTGMTDEVKARALDPFFTTKPTGEGTGLGLATVFGLARQNAGEIELETKLGSGTTFHIRLPASDKELETEKEADRQIEVALPGQGRILLVEDDVGVRGLTREILERQGYSVVEAGSGSEALKITEDRRTTLDVLITDMVMPGMNGSELATKLKQRFPELRSLFISGFAPPDHTDWSAGHFLQKPFSSSELFAALEILGVAPPATKTEGPLVVPSKRPATDSDSRPDPSSL